MHIFCTWKIGELIKACVVFPSSYCRWTRGDQKKHKFYCWGRVFQPPIACFSPRLRESNCSAPRKTLFMDSFGESGWRKLHDILTNFIGLARRAMCLNLPQSVDSEPSLSFCSQSQTSHSLHVNRAIRKGCSTTVESGESRPRPRANGQLQWTRKRHETCSKRLLALAKITLDVTLIPEGRLL